MDEPENSNGKFEQQWRDAFEDASQVPPPPKVWERIDYELAQQDLMIYKSRALFYRRVAAGLVLIASSLLALQYYYFHALDRGAGISVVAEGSGKDYTFNRQETFYPHPFEWTLPWKTGISQMSRGNAPYIVLSQDVSAGAKSMDNNSESGMAAQRQARKTWRMDPISVAPEIPPANLSHKVYRVVDYAYVQQSPEKIKTRFWIGTDIGKGTFVPNYQSAATTLSSTLTSSASTTQSSYSYSSVSQESASTSSPVVSEQMRAGTVKSYGLDFGWQLGKRWVLQSGLEYSQQNASSLTNMVLELTTVQESIPVTSQARGLSLYSDAVASEEVIEYEYKDVDMNNQFRFLSVPVSLGYLLVDRRVSLMLSTGIVSNIYLGNKLTDSDEGVASLTIGSGSSSPYRTASFSGMGGFEIGYRFGDHLDLTMEPYYRRAITTLTKSDADFIVNPSGIGVKTGIRYVFN